MLLQEDPTRSRAYARYSTRRSAQAVQDGFTIPCMVLDISARGARVRFDPIAISIFRGTRCSLTIDGIGTFPAEVRWRDVLDMGMRLRVSDSVADALGTTLRTMAAANLSSGG